MSIMQSGFESSARLSAVRWTVAGKLNEQLVRPARQTGEFFLPPDHKACMQTPQHFRVHQLGATSARSRSSSKAEMSAHSSSPTFWTFCSMDIDTSVPAEQPTRFSFTLIAHHTVAPVHNHCDDSY